jgi:hypothetical protein
MAIALPILFARLPGLSLAEAFGIATPAFPRAGGLELLCWLLRRSAPLALRAVDDFTWP